MFVITTIYRWVQVVSSKVLYYLGRRKIDNPSIHVKMAETYNKN